MDLFVHVLAFNGYLVKTFGEREVNNFFFLISLAHLLDGKQVVLGLLVWLVG